MKKARLYAGLVLLCAGALHADAPPEAGGGTYRYRRTVQVAAPGWVRIRLTATMLARMGPEAEDYVIRAPGGGILPAFPWREPQAPPPAIRAAELKNMETVSGGWRVEGDLGPGAQKHRLLMADLPGTGLAEGVYLESSADGTRWHSLARGSMFRLGRWGLTSKTYLEYAPTRDRYIRLFWPTGAGFPAWRAVWVADWSEGSTETVEDPLPFTPVWKTDNEAAFRLTGPRSPIEQGSIVLDLPLPYPVRARLTAGRDGAWRTLSETICYPDRAAVLSVPPEAFSGPAMLVLNAGGFAIPPLTGVALRSVPRCLLFRAEGPGNYAFCYGAAGQSAPAAIAPALPAMPATWTEGAWGPETEAPLPALPAPSLAAGAALPACTFQGSWKLTAPKAKAGDLAVVELPAESYALMRTDMGDIRLAAGDHQVPYVLWSPPEGTVAASLGNVTPRADSEGGRSVLELDLPAIRLPLTVLDLAAPAAPFTREVTLQAEEERADEGTGRRRDQWTLLDGGTWRCPGVADLPSRFSLRARPVASRHLRIIFADKDNAPLPKVDVTLWRRRHFIIFPWPMEPVELLAGCPQLPAPTYDLEALRDDLAQRPAIPAEATPGPPAGAERPHVQLGDGKLAHLALLGGLGLALAFIVLVLVRAVRREPEGG